MDDLLALIGDQDTKKGELKKQLREIGQEVSDDDADETSGDDEGEGADE